jgi:hypothetical protein
VTGRGGDEAGEGDGVSHEVLLRSREVMTSGCEPATM